MRRVASLISFALLACGGETADKTNDAASDSVIEDAGVLGAGDARQKLFCEVDAAVCPATPPNSGQSCDQVGLQCEWGTACASDDTMATCSESGWSIGLPIGACLTAKCPVDAGTCSKIEECVTDTGWCTCEYAKGAWSWNCHVGECPGERPRLGSSCTPPKEGVCFYPTVPCNVGVVCVCGMWQARDGLGCTD